MIELLHFTGDWCNPCKKIKPLIENYIENNPEIKWTLVDVDTQFQMIEDYNIKSVPTLIVLVDGLETKRHTGLISSLQLKELLS